MAAVGHKQEPVRESGLGRAGGGIFTSNTAELGTGGVRLQHELIAFHF